MKFSGIENVARSVLLQQLKTQAHIWFFRSEIILSNASCDIFLSQLSADEKQRYHGFCFTEDKQNYLIAHTLLRFALSKYVDLAPERWLFSCDARGKPEIDKKQKLPAIDFNITHTSGLCACVITMGAASGIDAENINRACNYKGLAQRMFSEQECTLLAASEQPSQQFYKYWTLREAYFKAIGSGLSGSSKDFSFMLDNDDENIFIQHKAQRQEDCQLALYEPTDEHMLSVVIKKKEKISFNRKQLVIREVSLFSEESGC